MTPIPLKTKPKELEAEVALLQGKAADPAALQFCKDIQGFVRTACQAYHELCPGRWRAKATKRKAAVLRRQLRKLCRAPLRYPKAETFRKRLLGPEQKRFFTCFVPLDFKGTVQCDGYDAYNRLAQRSGQVIKLAYCWAHVRRKFNEALEGAPRTAGWMIKQIQLLYRIESRLRDQKAGPALRQAVRASQSKPVMERIKKACTLLVRKSKDEKTGSSRAL